VHILKNGILYAYGSGPIAREAKRICIERYGDPEKKKSGSDGAAEAGADVLVTPCPLCHKSMDAVGENEPVLQLTQIINVACGLSSEDAAWDLNKKKVKMSFSSCGI